MKINLDLKADTDPMKPDGSNYDFSELAELIKMNSNTHNKKGVDLLGKRYQSLFEKLGYHTKRYPRNDIGDHLLFSAQTNSGNKLLLLGHLDTVLPPEVPNLFSEDKEWIYGQGVCDMKGGIHVAICALREVAKRRGSIANIDVLLVSDEETGSDDSRQITAVLAKSYQACLVFEAAGKNGEVVVGRKGVGTFAIDLSGKAAHAGNNYLQGADANLAAAKMLIKLNQLTNLAQGTTVNVGKISGGIGANTISPNAHLLLEIRYKTHNERDRLLAAINGIVATEQVKGVSAKLSGGIQRDVMQANDKQAQFLAKLESILGEKLPTETRGGVSDANIVSAAGVVTLDGFGPFGEHDHTKDERACKKSFVKRVQQVSLILLEYNGVKTNI
ncbi:M20 family metallopeptidase [Colwellia sp. MB02u-10]|uniref:M20 family metallopeptidase n=1 Tax=Colwellia sp. MB02u-10 TaxID=2759828 RepID=UPI0021754429|nr:M20 family metallopeptidase [Colwellia sp. MB02u-10]